MKKIKIAIIVFFLLFFTLGITAPSPANAMKVWDGGNFAGRMVEYVMQAIQKVIDYATELATEFTQAWTGQLNLEDQLDRELVQMLKDEFIQYINSEVSDIFVSGNLDELGNPMPYFVTDWTDYLYKKPQDSAKDYIEQDYLVDKLSGGKCSSDYTGSDYYDYLCRQGGETVQKTSVTTTLPEYLSEGADPQENLFVDGDLRAFSAYFECGNNPYCTSHDTKALYAQVAAQKKEVAAQESSGAGVLPQKNDDGTTAVPSTVYEYSINDAISIGNQAVVNADTWQEALMAVAQTMMTGALEDQYFTGTGVDYFGSGFFEEYTL